MDDIEALLALRIEFGESAFELFLNNRVVLSDCSVDAILSELLQLT